MNFHIFLCKYSFILFADEGISADCVVVEFIVGEASLQIDLNLSSPIMQAFTPEWN